MHMLYGVRLLPRTAVAIMLIPGGGRRRMLMKSNAGHSAAYTFVFNK